jgi:hypothetical protein
MPADTEPITSNSTLITINDESTTHATPLHLAVTENAETDSSAPVPDILLSLAKDDRYISHTFNLLAQTIVPLVSLLFPPRQRRREYNRNNSIGEEILDQDGHAFIERIRPELHLVAAAIVHSASFVFYTRHFGMETSGGKGARRSIGMESLNLAYSFPKRERRRIVGTDGKSFIGERYIKSLMLQTTNNVNSFVPDRWQSLLILQTMIPYLIQRAGRGGWSKDLGGLVTPLLECVGGRRLGTTMESGIDVTNGDGRLRNDDRLRGMERRGLFEAQRRRMVASAASASEIDPVNTGESTQENNEPSSSDAANNDELVKRIKKAAEYSWDFLRVGLLRFVSLHCVAHSTTYTSLSLFP